LLILQLVRLLDFFFRFLSGNKETGDTATGNVAQKANHLALNLARHFHAVDLETLKTLKNSFKTNIKFFNLISESALTSYDSEVVSFLCFFSSISMSGVD
jgi:hypothetical protein